MQAIDNINQFKTLRKSLNHQTIGCVMTMGCLHQGHASLIQQSVEENDLTIVTVFINPLQFNNSDDLEQYPKTLEADLKLIKKMGADFTLHPTVDSLYPNGPETTVKSTHPLSQTLEGSSRPGHFDGMLTIVLKLLNLIQPTKSYFGEKDYQQVKLIQSMAEDFFIASKIIACPTIREKSGLPLSSRNTRLSKDGLKTAQKIIQIFHQTEINTILNTKQILASLDIKIDYLEHYNNQLFIAFYVENVRLIDHFNLNKLI